MADAAVNAQQIAYWNAQAGATWAETQERLDRQLKVLGQAAQAALALAPGERVLDIGCGCGATTLELAHAVGALGQVTGVDISEPMLAVARSRARVDSGAPVTWMQADVQGANLGRGAFDCAYSRFGVMFFADPAAAFANIRRAIRPEGRVAFVCWRGLSENKWMWGPLEAAATVLPPLKRAEPGAPGPFAFADPHRLRVLLEAGGWSGISVAAHDALIGVGGVEETLALALKVGPLGAALRESPELAPKVTDAVRAFLSAHENPEDIRLPAAVWIVTARL